MPHVIAVAAPVGGGKSSLVRGLADGLPDATAVHTDSYEAATRQSIEDIEAWMHAGADPDRLPIPGLAEDLERLRRGEAVRDPATGAPTPSARFIVLETAFGRLHQATGRHIDWLIWIDTPLDVALARKLRELSDLLVDEHRERGYTGGLRWLQGYLDNYLRVVGPLMELQRERVRAHADVVLDGREPPAALLAAARRGILERFGAP